MTTILEKLHEAKAIVDGERDNMLEAIGMLAAAFDVQVVSQRDDTLLRPAIVLPERLFNRLREITPDQTKVNSEGD